MLVGCSKRILSLPRSCSISSRELYCKSAYRGLKRSEVCVVSPFLSIASMDVHIVVT
jgi:hypothetical protein